MLSCFGARCCTSTNAKPVSLGNDLSNCSNASRPPADAPTPTTDSGCAFVGLPRLDETRLAACGVAAGFTRGRAFLSFLEGRMFGPLAFFAIKPPGRPIIPHIASVGGEIRGQTTNSLFSAWLVQKSADSRQCCRCGCVIF